MRLQEEGEAVGEQLQALEDGLQDYGPNVKAAAGAIVTIDRNGEAVIHRGLMREAEAKALRTLERLRQGFGGEAKPRTTTKARRDDDRQPKTAAMSDRLAQRLSAHRTAALQIEVARHPQVALAALVHGMVQTVLQGSHYGHDLPLGVRLKVQDRLEGMAPDWPNRPPPWRCANCNRWRAKLAGGQRRTVRRAAGEFARRTGAAAGGMRGFHGGRGDAPRHAAPTGAELAQAVGLDMAAWWKPTAEGYFKHVSKAVILEAVGEYAPEHVTRLAKLKKADIASEAERLADGTGWMPAIFKAEGPQDAMQAEGPEQDAPEDAEAMADEPAEALAA
jgi:ParB family chromosome partitioning protein